MTYSEWCLERSVTHGHCPRGCEHPQPREVEGQMACGRCWVLCGDLTPIVPCDEEVCR